MDIGAAEHDAADQRHRGKRHENLGGKRSITPFIAEEPHAQQDEQHQHSRLGSNENHRHGKGRERLIGKTARPQKPDDSDHREHAAWDGGHPTHDAQHAEHLQQQGHLRFRSTRYIVRAIANDDCFFPFPVRHDAPSSNVARLRNHAPL